MNCPISWGQFNREGFLTFLHFEFFIQTFQFIDIT